MSSLADAVAGFLYREPQEEEQPERSFTRWPLCLVSWREALLVDLGTGKKNHVGTRALTTTTGWHCCSRWNWTSVTSNLRDPRPHEAVVLGLRFGGGAG